MQSFRRKAENPPPSYIRDKRAGFLQRRREKRNKEGIDMERKDVVSCKQGNCKKKRDKSMNDLQVVEQELSDAIMREMRQAMQTKNISLTLLADMSGVPLETVERLESGRLDVKLDEAMRVLHVLGLTLKVVPL
jgi:DNA-binding helix-turn-helix protein